MAVGLLLVAGAPLSGGQRLGGVARQVEALPDTGSQLLSTCYGALRAKPRPRV